MANRHQLTHVYLHGSAVLSSPPTPDSQLSEMAAHPARSDKGSRQFFNGQHKIEYRKTPLTPEISFSQSTHVTALFD